MTVLPGMSLLGLDGGVRSTWVRATRPIATVAVAALNLMSPLGPMTSWVAAATDPLPECAGKQTQMDLNICASDVLKRADADLNAVYQTLLKKLTPEEIKLARKAQSTWILFRDAECMSESGGGPNQSGTIWPLIYDECLVDLTRKRTKELREQVKCPGGHLEC